MRKILCMASLVFIISHVTAQKNYSLSASANFNFGSSGLGANNSGFGFSIQSNLFANQNLELKAEGSLDHLFGDKILVTDTLGNKYPSSATLISFRAGPELFISKNIAIAALPGYTRYQLYSDKSHSFSYKLALTSYLGKRKKTQMGIYFTKFTGDRSYVHFWGINMGFKIL